MISFYLAAMLIASSAPGRVSAVDTPGMIDPDSQLGDQASLDDDAMIRSTLSSTEASSGSHEEVSKTKKNCFSSP
jgi:hypothetical protein